MNKTTFMANFDTINTVDIQLGEAMEIAKKAEESRDFSATIRGITVGLSSGTSGNRGVFLVSEKERAYWVAMVLDRVIGFTFKKRKVAFFLRANSNLYNSVKSKVLFFQFFDLLKPVEDQLKALNDLQPDILVAQPSLLIELAKATETGKLNIHPTKVISVAEVLTPEDKNYLSRVFGQIIHQVYQCTEGLLASSCKYGTLHFHEDYLIIEKKYLDDEKIRFHPIITDLKRRSQPIIRYELNDIIVAGEKCLCGNKMLAIEAIEGRADDILVFINNQNQEVKIFPDFFRRAIILSDCQITNYALVQSKTNLLLLFIENEDVVLYNKAKDAITHLLNHYQVFNVEIIRTKTNETIRGNKLRRIKNDIGKIS